MAKWRVEAPPDQPARSAVLGILTYRCPLGRNGSRVLQKSTPTAGSSALRVDFSETDLPKGVRRVRALPDPSLRSLWDSIIVEGTLKNRLLSQAALNFVLRERVERTVVPLHGVILLVGPPGTGKTSLALGLANRTAESFKSRDFQLIEVDPHELTSSAMGKTQRAVSDLFARSIGEAALRGPTIVLLDEVETLAVDRAKLSLEANPVDIHRATDAVLVQLDSLAEHHRNLLFIATSNVPRAIDTAFISRCDLVLHVPPPDRDACRQILLDCINGLAQVYHGLANLPSSAEFENCIDEAVGLDGRAVRKAVGNALASRLETALDPNKVVAADLLMALRSAKDIRNDKGSATC